MSDVKKQKNPATPPAPVTAGGTPQEIALAKIQAARIAAREAIKAARKEAQALAPDCEGPQTGVLIRVLSTERDAIHAYCARVGKSVQDAGRAALVAMAGGN